jgi:APA family basic amino acid/polyamine antiporter
MLRLVFWPALSDILRPMSIETLPAAGAPRSRSGLLRILGFWDGIAVIVGVIIGSGILRTPGIIAGELGRPGAIFSIWILGALIALANSLVLAELVAEIPRVGGKYVYARAAFGPLAGFVTGWSEIVSRGMTAAAKAVVMGEYLVLLLGTGSVRILAVGLVLGFACLHWIGLRPVRAFQNAATFSKVLILVGVSAVAFALGRGFRWEAPVEEPATALGWLAAFAIAFQAVTFTYYGCDEATKLAEEVRDPRRELPRVLAVGILMVAVIYLLVNAAFLFVLSPAEMVGSSLVARDVAGRLLGSGAATFVTLAALVVLLGSLNVNFLSLPRVGLAMAQDGLAPSRMVGVSASGTPRVALLVATAVVILAALSGSFQTLIFFIMLIALTVDSLVILGLFRLRRLHPEWERPFLVPLYPALPIFVLVVYAAFLIAIAISYPLPAALALAVLCALTLAGFVWTKLGGSGISPVQGSFAGNGGAGRGPDLDG